jgi:acyl-CoA hydrolase
MRRLTLEQLPAILGRLPIDPRIVASGNFATPQTLLSAVDAALPAYTLHVLNAQAGVPTRPGVTLETAFVGPGMRGQPGLHYVPCRLSLVPVLFQRILPPDMVVLHTSPVHDGAVSLGIEVNVLPAAVDAVRARGGIVVAQANPQMPYTFGDAELHLDDIDYLVEVDESLPQAGFPEPDDVSVAIGDVIAAQVDSGATLQLGIGSIPDAVLRRLGGKRDLRLYSEMFSDGVWQLEQAGRLDSDVPLIASFLFGSTELYSWVHRNPRVRMMRTEITNDPARIARQRIMTSINGALQVDLSAQANASRIGGRIYSGFGGSTDFIVGALHSPGGHAYMALPSWHPRADISTIVPQIEGPVTSFQHSAVVTEQGMALVFGNSEAEQTHQIIERCAHPDARPELWQAAKRMGRA